MNTDTIGSKKTPRSNSFKKVSNQDGWTMWSLMFILAFVFVVGYIVMQLVPIYSANGTIKNAMKVAVEGKNLRQITRKGVIGKMTSQLYIDGISDLLDYSKEVKVVRDGRSLTIQATYSREVPLVSNIKLVADFSPKLECTLDGSQSCSF